MLKRRAPATMRSGNDLVTFVIYEGEKNVDLCTGFCCIFNEEASRKFLREWRHKVDATGAQGSFDQLQVNQMYKTWTASQKIRTVVELDYVDYQRCL